MVARRGERNPNWKGGRYRLSDGYVMVRIYPEDFFYPMAKKSSYILEHRLVMARHLGRCLQSWEIVHHKNGIKDDNRLENLELSAHTGEHSTLHAKGYRDGYQKGLRDSKNQRIKLLEEEIRRLKAITGEMPE